MRRIDIQKLKKDIKLAEDRRSGKVKDRPEGGRYDPKVREWTDSCSLGTLNILYAVRAHHRNKVHGAKRWVSYEFASLIKYGSPFPLNEFSIHNIESPPLHGHFMIDITLEDQWRLIETTWNKYILPERAANFVIEVQANVE